ncbi:hypothetical protein GCM10009677_53130 [Sphaerisporangium rubeum]|uniref:Tellurite resistance protein TerA n=1 Tax=Sphaerisporangium rubeum TaxID=321317 RepID=A0A7X0II33_9ACTN|nr:tellurium resistance protein [Sphaerisporangium rubeum]MBB6475582.1 tellurite resistance protein TerA [Sphaerisporangium rubeum]
MAEQRRVTLTKDAPRMDIPRENGRMRVNLTWNSTGSSPIDLDLCCLWELTDGSRGCVQALGGKFRVPRDGDDPVIALDRDERAGGPEGENMTIDMARAHLISRVLVFAYIYHGVPNWAAANGVATIHPVSGPPIEVPLDGADPRARVCAMFMLRNTGGRLAIRREVRYFTRGHRQMDATYKWGLTWRPGIKRTP